MKQIILNKDNSYTEFLYKQLYSEMKKQIISGDFGQNEKLPSIRKLASETGISVTTVMQAYNQLLAEGYIYNRPGSGYYIENEFGKNQSESSELIQVVDVHDSSNKSVSYICDEEIFDFNKWKKCSNKVFNEYRKELLYESELKGEYALRYEISQYLNRSRGVNASPNNIVISAGTQQIAFHLGRVLRRDGVSIIALESPGYAPVKSMFEDAAFNTIDIPVTSWGIDINLLPSNVKTSVYVNPSNQFPTGVVMPAGKRYEILNWANVNNSYIIEDDYNSELRYFGQPLPPIKSLDTQDKVIYLGSFSSTLFPAIKISYMVLPNNLTNIFDAMPKNYTQTCSKSEQLTLAEFMKEGLYYSAIKKKRTLNSKKLQAAINAFSKYGNEKIILTNTNSGLTLTLKVETDKTASELVNDIEGIGVRIYVIDELKEKSSLTLMLYYSEIPLDRIDSVICEMINLL